VLFNHIGLDHEVTFLERIPHLAEYFAEPVVIEEGVYRTPRQAGSSCALFPAC
jgi:L-fuconate dehydratase